MSKDDSKSIIIFKALIHSNKEIFLENIRGAFSFLILIYGFFFYFARTHSIIVMFSYVPYYFFFKFTFSE